jgi:PPOX class probable F420-dependent enzyme
VNLQTAPPRMSDNRGMASLSSRQVALLTSGKHFGVVATVDADGRPQTSVIWVDSDGEHLVFNTTNARAKGRNLRENPRISISVWDNDDPYRYFEVEGIAELDEEGAADHIHALSLRYEQRRFRTPFDRVIVRVTATRVFDHWGDD